MACTSGWAAFIALSVSSPFNPGIMTSSSTTSGLSPDLTDASISSPRV